MTDIRKNAEDEAGKILPGWLDSKGCRLKGKIATALEKRDREIERLKAKPELAFSKDKEALTAERTHADELAEALEGYKRCPANQCFECVKRAITALTAHKLRRRT